MQRSKEVDLDYISVNTIDDIELCALYLSIPFGDNEKKNKQTSEDKKVFFLVKKNDRLVPLISNNR